MRRIAPILFALLAASTAFAQDAAPAKDLPFRYHGRVYADTNGNGLFDRGEAPIAGARVSNFWKTVVTDAQGRYDFKSEIKLSLTPPEIPVISLLLPPGYSLYRSEDRFRYVEYEGRTDFEADFGLKPDATTLEKDFCWIALSDAKYEDMIRRITPYLNRMGRKPRFLITTGDTFLGSWGENTWKTLREKDGDAALAKFRENLAALNAESRVPIFNVLGNHHGMWQQLQGTPCFTFHWGDVVFVCRGTWQIPSHAELKKVWQTREAQDNWLRRELRALPEGTRVVHVQHYRPGDNPEERYRMENWRHWKTYEDAQLSILGMYWGHSHRAGPLRVNHGALENIYAVNLPAAEVHSLRDAAYVPFGFFLSGIKDGKFWTSYEIDDTDDFFEVISPAEGEAVPAGPLRIFVNAGGVITTAREVTALLDDVPVAMKRVGRYAFVAEMPPNVAAGQHALHVEATTLGGKVTWTKDVAFGATGKGLLAVKPGANWTGTAGGDLGTGDVGASGKAPLRLAWATNVGAPTVVGGPLIVDGKVYFHLGRYSLGQPAGVAVLDAATGKPVDLIDQSDIDVNHLAQDPLLYDDGRLLVTYPYRDFSWSYGSHISAMIDLKTNKRLWVANPVKGGYVIPTRLSGNTFLGNAQSTNGKKDAERVPFRHIALFDADQHEQTWKSEPLWSEPGHYDMTDNGREIPAVDRATGELFTTVACLSLADGKTIWKHDQNLYTYVEPRRTNIALGRSGVYAHGFAWNRKTGDELWAHPNQDTGRHREKYRIAGFAAVSGDVVVFAWPDGLVRAHDAATGKVLWQKETKLELTGGIAVMGGAAYTVSKQGFVCGFDLTTGSEVWRKRLGCPVFASPAVSGNALYLIDWGGTAYAFVGG